MTVPLPPEILHLIATFLKNDGTSLVPCTCVCRLWQRNFESFVYSSLIVYSDDEHKEEDQPGISLADFQRLTSGDGVRRQAWIRNLDYNILVPYELLDWTTRKEWKEPEAYCIENPVRKANDLAFQTAMLSLFHALHSWASNQTPYLKLNLAVRGRPSGPAPEPRTEDWDIAGEYCWDYKTGRTFSVPPYRAQFLNNDLPFAPCIEKLSFKNHDPGWGDHHQIWTGAVQTIIQNCPKLVQLELNLNEWVRPDHLEYIQLRRAALSSLIGSISRSLRVLQYEGPEDSPWKYSMPALDVIPSGVDSMSINLRHLSVHLEELKLNNTRVPYDFMCPLDETGQPEPDSLHLNWPNLKTLEIEFVPFCYPSGETTFHHTPEAQTAIDKIEDWENEICDVEAGWGLPELRTEEYFHRLLISLGHAARRMPCLKGMKFEVEGHSATEFKLYCQNNTDITLGWECYPLEPYRPDNRVAKAWNFDLHDVRAHPRWEGAASVILRSWPPDMPIQVAQ